MSAAPPPITPAQQMEIMNDVTAYVIENAGDVYARVSGILYCALVNLVMAQNGNNPAASIAELENIAAHYNSRIRFVAAKDDGVRH